MDSPPLINPRLAEAEAELAVQMEKLTEKQAELKEVEDALKILNDQVCTESIYGESLV